MSKIQFSFDGEDIIIPCRKEDKIKNIFSKFSSNVKIDINSLYFLYGGVQLINLELTFYEQANSIDKERNEMNILVYEFKKSNIISEVNSKINPRIIKCPKCGEDCIIKIKDYKIKLYDCKNWHETNNIFLDEFENIKNINKTKFECNICDTNNKNKIYKEPFYSCLTCNKNLCSICKTNHNNNHKIIDYEKKDYICSLHNSPYISYSEDCKINLCLFCEKQDNYEKILI